MLRKRMDLSTSQVRAAEGEPCSPPASLFNSTSFHSQNQPRPGCGLYIHLDPVSLLLVLPTVASRQRCPGGTSPPNAVGPPCFTQCSRMRFRVKLLAICEVARQLMPHFSDEGAEGPGRCADGKKAAEGSEWESPDPIPLTDTIHGASH